MPEQILLKNAPFAKKKNKHGITGSRHLVVGDLQKFQNHPMSAHVLQKPLLVFPRLRGRTFLLQTGGIGASTRSSRHT